METIGMLQGMPGMPGFRVWASWWFGCLGSYARVLSIELITASSRPGAMKAEVKGRDRPKP